MHYNEKLESWAKLFTAFMHFTETWQSYSRGDPLIYTCSDVHVVTLASKGHGQGYTTDTLTIITIAVLLSIINYYSRKFLRYTLRVKWTRPKLCKSESLQRCML